MGAENGKNRQAEGAKLQFIVRNRKAWHDYEVLESCEAGISLMGSDVKSMRLDMPNRSTTCC